MYQILPQKFYLSILNQQIFFCYDKISGKHFECNVKDVAQQNKFYESHNLFYLIK